MINMKKTLFILLFVVLISGCDGLDLTPEADATEELIQDADCYENGLHPTANSIVSNYSDLTDYNEVMIWFCNGADFEDILIALLTEEITSIEAEGFLRRISGGEAWIDIWYDLGIVDE